MNPIKIKLDKVVTDSVPFFPVMNFIKDEKDSNAFGIPSIDSPELKSIKINEHTDSKITFFQGFQDKQPVFVFDSNNNGNFLDEKVYRLAKDSAFVELRNHTLRIGKFALPHSFLIKPSPATIFAKLTGNNSKRKSYFGISMRPIFRYGIFRQSPKLTWRFALFNNFESAYTDKNSILVVANTTFPSPHTFPVRYRVGDTLYLDRRIYLFESLTPDGNNIVLKQLGILPRNFGISEGKFAFNLAINDLQAIIKQPYIIGKSGKITLLDFWGTWCVPCIELTADLKKLQKTHLVKDFEIIGIAYDKNINDVEEYIQINEISWLNAWDDFKNPVISKKFLINEYPTFILLDRSGKIIFRGSGKEALMRVEKFLQSF